MSQNKIRQALHQIDPYQGMIEQKTSEPIFGWYSRDDFFQTIVKESQPRLIIEVGTWLGASAFSFAKAVRDFGCDSEILCVDTWLGSEEFWETGIGRDGYDRYKSLQLKQGFPTVYYEFLANMLNHGVADLVTPFPTTSTIAALWLARRSYRGDIIYLDASHDQESVARDIASYFPLLSDKGVLIGDDHSEGWPGVIEAVASFSKTANVRINIMDEKWFVRQKETWPLGLANDVLAPGKAGELSIIHEGVEGFVDFAHWSADGRCLKIEGWCRKTNGDSIKGILVVADHSRYILIPSDVREDLVNPDNIPLVFRGTVPTTSLLGNGNGLRLYAIMDDKHVTPLTWWNPNLALPAMQLGSIYLKLPNGTSLSPLAPGIVAHPVLTHIADEERIRRFWFEFPSGHPSPKALVLFADELPVAYAEPSQPDKVIMTASRDAMYLKTLKLACLWGDSQYRLLHLPPLNA